MHLEGGLFTLGYAANLLGGIMRLFQLWWVAFEQMDLFGLQSHAKHRLSSCVLRYVTRAIGIVLGDASTFRCNKRSKISLRFSPNQVTA